MQQQHDTERVLGKLEEFKSWARLEFRSIDTKFMMLHQEMKKFDQFKIRVYTTASLISCAVVLGMDFVFKKIWG